MLNAKNQGFGGENAAGAAALWRPSGVGPTFGRRATSGRFWLVAAFVLLSAACASAPPQPAQPVALTEQQAAKLIEEGRRVLMQGIPDKAISQYFEPVIQSYDRQHAGSSEQLFTAHFSVESLIYMATAAAAKPARSSSVLGPSWSDALFLKGYALVELSRFDEAITALKRATDLAPMYAPYWSELGNAYQTQKRWEEAMAAYTNAASGAEIIDSDELKNGDLTRAWRGMGFVLVEQGHLDEAEAQYQKCLALDAGDNKAKQELEYVRQQRLRLKNSASGALAP